MTDGLDWKQEVAQWRASGLTAEAFCKDRGFNRARLWAWSSRLLKAERKATAPRPDIRLARVVRKASEDKRASELVLEIHDVRVLVGRGADRETLAMVLSAVDAVRTRR